MIANIMTNNKNVAHVCRVLVEEGCDVLRVEYGRKHNTVHFRTPDGVSYWTRLSNAPVDPHKLGNFTRQSIRRAASRVEHARIIQQNRR